ncbi:MAG: bifunctional ornithine acetyltransferase/N-acetylglutamate synthase [Alphaproteobacteria bacterium CG_4_10_14_0_2_um_filter_63_37]|nr:MAG: bifunctional ornithine acetyltransferase/N-acetylglutamate synthase [Proteobacteria bacterium CG1_02_64_396]PJA24919.1 MAG: bifunctional ornithine acetyltransferase/N-acetylglutamate synthase [Alphaproteobacteria bacterium CG_4_10_14_0_2_um_filter_63_37]
MPIGPTQLPDLQPIAGLSWGIASVGVKNPTRLRPDVAVLVAETPCVWAGAFTLSGSRAAPVRWSEARKGLPFRALVVNSGNANACTGNRGMEDVATCASRLGQAVGLEEGQAILAASTGVIGELLPMERLLPGIDAAFADRGETRWEDAARAIMTTDIFAKGASLTVDLPSGGSATFTGIAKGSGMIHPNMATMLGFIGTDADLDETTLSAMLRRSVEESFNTISVDGDTSTNDCVFAVATGRVAVEPRDKEMLEGALLEICKQLADAILRDGEGVTRIMNIQVEGARDDTHAKKVADTVATSPLVKTALFGADPNWGRIAGAIGRADPELEWERVSIYLGPYPVVVEGQRHPDYREEQGAEVFKAQEVDIAIDLGVGRGRALKRSTDLSYDYIKINADYRS